MEQGRAPAVQLHRPQLAWAAADQLSSVLELIASTTTSTGAKLFAPLDPTVSPTKVKVPKDQIAAVNITGHDWTPE